MDAIKILNYQGNKTSLMPFINEVIRRYVSPGDIICDLFSGSGSVGSYLNKDFSIISNDIELYSSIVSAAILNTPTKKIIKKSKEIFLKSFSNNYEQLLIPQKEVVAKEEEFLAFKLTNDLINLYAEFPTIWNGKDKSINYKNLRNNNNYDLFLHYYSGSYFGIKQSIQIDAIIKTIHEFNDPDIKNVLYSCLFYAMNETVFSKDGHMAQPLSIEKNSRRHFKQRNKDIKEYFASKLDEFINKSLDFEKDTKSKVFNEDLSNLLSNTEFKKLNISLIYADPPYTDMQYSRYYHLLNVAAKYNYPEPTIIRGKFTKGLYTEGRNQSELSKKSTAKKQLVKLLNFCKTNSITLALSYAYPKNEAVQKVDRYTISIVELVEMAKEIFGAKKVQIERTSYKHANNKNSSSKEVYEYLIVCGREIQESSYDFIDLKKKIKSTIPTSKNPIYNSHLYWSQKSFNIIDLLITTLSSENDIIFDPFMGSGVTVLEAVQNNMGRVGIGCDVNEMSKFLSENLLRDIPKSNLEEIFSKFKIKLDNLQDYYKTKCPICGEFGFTTKVVFDKPNRTEDNFVIKAISYKCSKCGNQVKTADKTDYCKFNIKNNYDHIPDIKLIPNSKIAVGKNEKISNIFTPRNFSVLNELVGYIHNVNNSTTRNVLNYLLMSILHLAKITDSHSNSQWPLWIPKLNCVEKNIIELLQKKMKNLLQTQNYIKKNFSNSKLVNNFSELTTSSALVLTKGSQFISNEDIPDDSVSLIITDPPYMDQVLYSEYLQLYKPFIGINFNLDDEIIVSSSPVRKKNKEDYFTLLSEVFEMCKNKLKENHIMCLFFHDSNLDVWVKLLQILELNGFKFISQEHIKKKKTVKNILSPKRSLSGDAILFFENTRQKLPKTPTSISVEEIKYSVFIESKKLLEKHGDLSTPELYDLGIMEMLIENGWLEELSKTYKSLVEIFEEYFIWKKDSAKWHLQIR